MERFKVALLLLFGCLVLISCENGRDPSTGTISIDLSKKTSNEEFQSYITDIRLVPLETVDASVFGNCDRLIIQDSLVYIFSKQEQNILCFGIDGKFRYSLLRRGRSGQEYLKASDIVVQNDLIGVYDNEKEVILFYDSQGEYVKSVEVCNGLNVDITSNGNFIVYSGMLEDFALNVFDSTGTSIYKGFENPEKVMDLPSIFSTNRPLSVFGDEVYFTNYFDPDIYSFDGGAIEKRCHFDFGKDNMSQGLLTKGSFVEIYERITQDPSVKSIGYLTVTPDWITYEAYKSIPVVVYYTMDKQKYFTNDGLESPLSVILSKPPMGFTSDGDYYTLVSSSNIMQGIIPLLEHNKEKYIKEYEFLSQITLNSIDHFDNPWLVLFRFK